MPSGGMAMRFDWYQATIQDHPFAIVETVAARLAPDGEVREGRGLHGYTRSATIRKTDGDRAALVLFGGNGGAHPNAQATGGDAQAFARVVREAWPVHKVTRFDAAEDLAQEGAYETLESACRALARERGLKGRAIVPDDIAEGRTYYVGSASSDVRTRLYDKTAEQRRLLPPERHGEVPDSWARIEVQVRPRKDAGYAAASFTPEQVWGCSSWTHELAQRLWALDVARIEMQSGRETDHQRAYRFMLRQYGPTLQRMLSDLGSWECVGLTIGDDLARMASSRLRT